MSEGQAISFGPFRLFPAARAFEKNGVPLALGNRALDILIVLVERAGEVISHRELMARVWRGLAVEPVNLRVHITSLRRALSDPDGQDEYVANVTGQGYCFVAPVRRETQGSRPMRVAEYPCGTARQRLVLPAVLSRMVGRDEIVRTVAADLVAERFVTLIGPGGIGKTTVAISVAHSMLDEFAGGVCFVDLGTIAHPNLVAPTIAATLGLTVQTDEVVPALMLCIRTLRVLLVLDNCEHVVDAVAKLAERIYQEAPAVHILATSREALRVEGEHACWVPPLQGPELATGVRAVDAVKFPAVSIFMERAAASGSRLDLTDSDASVVAGICARLDGVPLAIEIAAARVGLHGLEGTAELLKTRFGLQWPGRRTALPRHQTLHALLDWSYELLPAHEQLVFRRLSIFVGHFTLEAARAIARETASDDMPVARAVENLVAKSLLSVSVTSGRTHYRLLETTRVYAMEKLEESGEKDEIAQRHAQYFAKLLAALCDGPKLPGRAAALSEHLGNLRAALAWTFGEERTLPRNRALAIDLAASAVPILVDLSLLTECHEWSVAALALLDPATRGTRAEMLLQEARAISTVWALGNHDAVRVALARALDIARELRDTPSRLRLLAGMQIFLESAGELAAALEVAAEFSTAASEVADESYGIVGDFLLGGAHHFMGHQKAALAHLERGLAFAGDFELQLFGLDPRLRALILFGRALWISGFPDRSMAVAREAVRSAEAASRPLNVCFCYMNAAPLFLWCGELGAAREVLEKLTTHPNWHALPALHSTAHGLEGELLIREGEIERGVALLRSSISTSRADRQTTLLNPVLCAFAEGLLAMGSVDEASTLVHSAIAQMSEGSDASVLPELLRLKAEILMALPQPDEANAADALEQSLASARRQGALMWERRSTASLGRLRERQCSG